MYKPAVRWLGSRGSMSREAELEPEGPQSQCSKCPIHVFDECVPLMSPVTREERLCPVGAVNDVHSDIKQRRLLRFLVIRVMCMTTVLPGGN